MTSSHLSIASALILLSASAASALPLASTPLATTGGTAEIVQVRGGCGFGEHRGPLAGCRINNGPRGRFRAAVTGLPRGCPPGRHRGPLGGCRF